jgi:hypothetical protein
MALRDKNSRYAGMVAYILNAVPFEQLGYMLPYFIENPEMLRMPGNGDPLPLQYHRFFEYSDMVRIRNNNTDMSVITKNPTFFTFFKGNAALEAVRLSTAFFGKGQFQCDKIEKQGNTYYLSSVLEGPYYQPLPKESIPSSGEAWGLVPRSAREQSEVQKLNVKVGITESNAKANIKITVDGPKNMPVAVELAFRMNGKLTNVVHKKGINDAYLARNGSYVEYALGTDTIKIGPGVVSHNWTQLRGALPKLQAACVYFTQYAPCEIEFTVE